MFSENFAYVLNESSHKETIFLRDSFKGLLIISKRFVTFSVGARAKNVTGVERFFVDQRIVFGLFSVFLSICLIRIL